MAPTLSQDPGWQAAVAKERDLREAAYLGLPTPIAGGALLLPPLTLRQQLTLFADRNPIVCGGPVEEADAVAFLWFLEPDYFPGNAEGQKTFFARLGSLNLSWPSVIDELREYYAEQMLDAPAPRSGWRDESEAPPVCGTAVYIDLFASEFGWSREQTLGSPVACLNQERRCIRLRTPAKKRVTISGGRLSNAAERVWVEARRQQPKVPNP